MARKVTSKICKVTPAGRSRRNDASNNAASSTAASSSAIVIPSSGVVVAYDDGHGGVRFAPKWSTTRTEGIYMSTIHKTPATILMLADHEWHIDAYMMNGDTLDECLTWPGQPDTTTATTYAVYTFKVRYPLNSGAVEEIDDDTCGGVVDRVIGPSRWMTVQEVSDILNSINITQSDDS